MHNILVCDDDRDIVAALKIYLSGGEYRVFEAYNGAEAVEAVRKNDIHLVLMDIMMPGLDGIAATAAIRRESNAPIILLTAKSESSDKVLGLNVGADDYITKPFDPVEVLARVKSQLRRYTLLGAKPETAPERGIYTVGGVTLNEDAKSVTVDGESVSLTPLEFNILQLLIRSPGASIRAARSTSWCGTKIPSAPKRAWRYTSATCVRRSRSTPPSRAT